MKKLAVAAVIALVVGAFAMVSVAQGISKHQAYEKTLHYARHSCLVDNKCHMYAASSCIRHSGGVSCLAWNYERKRGKYTCKRLVFWKDSKREFLTQWKCNLPGWNWGPNR
jgi:hypothetical protein